MENINLKFTVLFEDPFWVGVYECEVSERYEVCKITFGDEPKDCEVYEMILKKWGSLRVTSSSKAKVSETKRINPKRMQRAIKKQVQDNGIGTKAQQVLKLQQEQKKLERKAFSREQKENDKERRFDLKQEKRKEKHRGH